MTLLSQPRHRPALAALLLSAALMGCGCQFDGSSIWEKHFSNSRKADAKRHWNDVRGDIQLQLAENHFEAGRLDEAEKVLEQALALAPDNARVYVLATRLHLEKGDLAKARIAISRAAALPGDGAEVEYLAGIVAQRYGDLEMALEHYAAAAIQEPQVAVYVLAQAETLVSLDKPIEAMELIESRLEDFDGNAAMRMLAAHLNETFGLRGPAVEYAREALRIQKGDAGLAAEAGRIMVWAGQYEEAIAVLTPLVESASMGGGLTGQTNVGPANSVSPSVMRDLARACLAVRRWREAQWALKPLMARDETDVAGWCMYAQAALMLGDLDAAAETIRTLHAGTAPTPESLLLAAHIALSRGDHAGAYANASQAVQMDGQFATAFCLLGRACEGLGRGQEARQAYVKAMALEPESPVAETLLNRLQQRDGPKTGPTGHGSARGPAVDKRNMTADSFSKGEP
ncbi:MAG TPA: tetratricopeptide repeat protein [Phycisphaerae bacterium]|nr:tetratricopeptide repeat protein [Phycisphaerae bacterium]